LPGSRNPAGKLFVQGKYILDRFVKIYDTFARRCKISSNKNFHPAQPPRLGGMVAVRISLPAQAGFEKQGQSGSDAGAPREASDSCLCEYGKLADEPESPPPFSNEIRTAMNEDRR